MYICQSIYFIRLLFLILLLWSISIYGNTNSTNTTILETTSTTTATTIIDNNNNNVSIIPLETDVLPSIVATDVEVHAILENGEVDIHSSVFISHTTSNISSTTNIPLTPYQLTLDILNKAIKIQQDGTFHRKLLDEEGLKLRTIWSVIVDTFTNPSSSPSSSKQKSTSSSSSSSSSSTLSILQDLEHIEELIQIRLSLEKGIEINEQARRAYEQRTPIPTAVPRKYEQSKVFLEPKELPTNVWELWEKQVMDNHNNHNKENIDISQTNNIQTQTLSKLNRQQRKLLKNNRITPTITKSGVQITILTTNDTGTTSTSINTNISNTNANQFFNIMNISNLGPTPSEYLRSQIKLLLLHIHALLLIKLHGLGVIEDYQGKIVRTFSPTLDEYLRSDIGISVLEGDEDDEHRRPLSKYMDNSLVNLRDLLNNINHPSTTSSTGNNNKPSKSSNEDDNEDEIDTVDIFSTLWLDLGIAKWNQETFDKSEHLIPERPQLFTDENNIEKKNKKDVGSTSSNTNKVKQISNNKVPSGSVLLDPLDSKRKYGTNGKGRVTGSIEWKQHTGLLSPILNARDSQEGKQILVIRILQLGGLIIAPIRGIYELIKLTYSFLLYLIPHTWQYASTPTMPVQIIETDENVIIEPINPSSISYSSVLSLSFIDTILYYEKKYSTFIWSYIRDYMIVPITSVLRYFSVPWAWNIIWTTSEYVIWDSIFTPFDTNYHRPEVVALEHILLYIQQLRYEIESMYYESKLHTQTSQGTRIVENSTVHIPRWIYTNNNLPDIQQYYQYKDTNPSIAKQQRKQFIHNLMNNGIGTLTCERILSKNENHNTNPYVAVYDTPSWSLLQYNPFKNYSFHQLLSTKSTTTTLKSTEITNQAPMQPLCYSSTVPITNNPNPNKSTINIELCPFRSIRFDTIGDGQWVGWKAHDKCTSSSPPLWTIPPSSPKTSSSTNQTIMWEIEKFIEETMYLPVYGIYKGKCLTDNSITSLSSSSTSSSSSWYSTLFSQFLTSDSDNSENLIIRTKFICSTSSLLPLNNEQNTTTYTTSSSSSSLPILRIQSIHMLSKCEYDIIIETVLGCSTEQSIILRQLRDLLGLFNETNE